MLTGKPSARQLTRHGARPMHPGMLKVILRGRLQRLCARRLTRQGSKQMLPDWQQLMLKRRLRRLKRKQPGKLRKQPGRLRMHQGWHLAVART